MSGKKSRAARRSVTANELHAVALLIQWHTLPGGECAQCGARTGAAPRTLLTLMGPVPTRDMRPGDPRDEAAADARFVRLAEQQKRGEYAIGSLQAVCISCAARALASTPEGIGVAQAFTRRAFPAAGTDVVFMDGEAGADKPVRWSVRASIGGPVLPKLEANCLDAASEALRDTPRVVFGWEGEP